MTGIQAVELTLRWVWHAADVLLCAFILVMLATTPPPDPPGRS